MCELLAGNVVGGEKIAVAPADIASGDHSRRAADRPCSDALRVLVGVQRLRLAVRQLQSPCQNHKDLLAANRTVGGHGGAARSVHHAHSLGLSQSGIIPTVRLDVSKARKVGLRRRTERTDNDRCQLCPCQQSGGVKFPVVPPQESVFNG